MYHFRIQIENDCIKCLSEFCRGTNWVVEMTVYGELTEAWMMVELHHWPAVEAFTWRSSNQSFPDCYYRGVSDACSMSVCVWHHCSLWASSLTARWKMEGKTALRGVNGLLLWRGQTRGTTWTNTKEQQSLCRLRLDPSFLPLLSDLLLLPCSWTQLSARDQNQVTKVLILYWLPDSAQLSDHQLSHSAAVSALTTPHCHIHLVVNGHGPGLTELLQVI